MMIALQVGDMGVDGRIYPVGTKPTDTGSMFADDWFPIQVKQSDNPVGRLPGSASSAANPAGSPGVRAA
jgi:hypothetical protein